jgi:hypothetical protein
MLWRNGAASILVRMHCSAIILTQVGVTKIIPIVIFDQVPTTYTSTILVVNLLLTIRIIYTRYMRDQLFGYNFRIIYTRSFLWR